MLAASVAVVTGSPVVVVGLVVVVVRSAVVVVVGESAAVSGEQSVAKIDCTSRSTFPAFPSPQIPRGVTSRRSFVFGHTSGWAAQVFICAPVPSLLQLLKVSKANFTSW